MADNKPISESVRFMEKMADILMDEANAEIEQLRKERDEARREVCHLMRSDDYNEPFDGTIFEYAIHRGWDCFKDHA